jgi:sugar phosphate isomerase/epimerase
MSGPEPENDKNLKIILDVLQRHNVKTQIWCMVVNIKDLDSMTQEQKVVAHARPLRYIAQKAAEIGCSMGLYNHGGWYGMPENQVQLIDYLKMPNLGIVYNFHHAEDDVARFPQLLPLIKPHLMAVTVMSLVKGPRAKVVPLGQGNAEQEMMRLVKESGYNGPVSIINEDTAPDAEEGLRINMNGLQQILRALGDTEALKTYKAIILR